MDQPITTTPYQKDPVSELLEHHQAILAAHPERCGDRIGVVEWKSQSKAPFECNITFIVAGNADVKIANGYSHESGKKAKKIAAQKALCVIYSFVQQKKTPVQLLDEYYQQLRITFKIQNLSSEPLYLNTNCALNTFQIRLHFCTISKDGYYNIYCADTPPGVFHSTLDEAKNEVAKMALSFLEVFDTSAGQTLPGSVVVVVDKKKKPKDEQSPPWIEYQKKLHDEIMYFVLKSFEELVVDKLDADVISVGEVRAWLKKQ